MKFETAHVYNGNTFTDGLNKAFRDARIVASAKRIAVVGKVVVILPETGEDLTAGELAKAMGLTQIRNGHAVFELDKAENVGQEPTQNFMLRQYDDEVRVVSLTDAQQRILSYLDEFGAFHDDFQYLDLGNDNFQRI